MTESYFKNQCIKLNESMLLFAVNKNERFCNQRIQDDWLYEIQENAVRGYIELEQYGELWGDDIIDEIWSVKSYLLKISRKWIEENFKIDSNLLDYMESRFN